MSGLSGLCRVSVLAHLAQFGRISALGLCPRDRPSEGGGYSRDWLDGGMNDAYAESRSTRVAPGELTPVTNVWRGFFMRERHVAQARVGSWLVARGYERVRGGLSARPLTALRGSAASGENPLALSACSRGPGLRHHSGGRVRERADFSNRPGVVNNPFPANNPNGFGPRRQPVRNRSPPSHGLLLDEDQFLRLESPGFGLGQ